METPSVLEASLGTNALYSAMKASSTAKISPSALKVSLIGNEDIIGNKKGHR